MEFEPQDQEIVSLLTRLKNAEGSYPEHMLLARRQIFLKQMAEIGMGVSPDASIPNVDSNASPPPLSPLTGTVLETALLVAILVEASAVAYFYRDKLADFFETITVEPRVEVVASPLIPTTGLEIQGVFPSQVPTSTLPSTSIVISPSPMGTTMVPAVTSLPGVAEENETVNAGGESGPVVVPVASTPLPGGPTQSNPGPGGSAGQTPEPDPTRDNGGNQGGQTPEPERTRENNGNHYGQTPKPERTKENNGNGPPGNRDNGPPGEELTPTPSN